MFLKYLNWELDLYGPRRLVTLRTPKLSDLAFDEGPIAKAEE